MCHPKSVNHAVLVLQSAAVIVLNSRSLPRAVTKRTLVVPVPFSMCAVYRSDISLLARVKCYPSSAAIGIKSWSSLSTTTTNSSPTRIDERLTSDGKSQSVGKPPGCGDLCPRTQIDRDRTQRVLRYSEWMDLRQYSGSAELEKMADPLTGRAQSIAPPKVKVPVACDDPDRRRECPISD